MTRTMFDFAVFGNEPLAWLVAGLLAGRNRRSVMLLPGQSSRLALQRSFDLSIGPITRPESWAMLGSAVPETAKLLSSIGGRSAVQRIDPILCADTAAGRQALGHIEHMARGFGHQVERLAVGDRWGLRFSDALWIDRTALGPVLTRWTMKTGVRVETGTVAATFAADGGVDIRGSEQLSAARAVLVGSGAIMEHCPNLPLNLRAVPATAVLTEPGASMLAPFMQQIDTGALLTQARSKAIVGTAFGTLPEALPRIGRLLSDHDHLRLAGRSEFTQVVSVDGAAVFGKIGAGPDVVLGMDATMAFLAPALARWLAGSASAPETAYFVARAPRHPDDFAVADYQAKQT